MDEALEKALEFANFSVTLNNQKRILKEKYTEDLVMYYNGGRFTVTREFYTFIMVLESDKTVVTDDNDTPIVINDVADLKKQVRFTYADATNKYLESYQTLSKQRTVDGIVDV